MCNATVYKPSTLPSLIQCGTFVIPVTFSSSQSSNVLVTDGPPAYPTRWGAWQDIEVGSGLAPIPLVTRPLPSSQKTSLMGCAALLFISPESSHFLSDVGLFVLTMTFSPTQSYDALITNGPPCLPHPLGRLARHRSRARVGSDTTCNGDQPIEAPKEAKGVKEV